MSSTLRLDRPCQFIGELATLLDSYPSESTLFTQVHPLLAELVHQDDWLPEDCAHPDSQRYQQYLLHVNSRQRFPMVSFVWGPGQITPICDRWIWDLIGILRGAGCSQPYAFDAGGRPHPGGARRHLEPGEVEALSPYIGDVHQVSNTFNDRISISIHIYGVNIGVIRCAVFSAKGEEEPSISGYPGSRLPNI